MSNVRSGALYEATIEFPGLFERTFLCDGPGKLRDLVWGVAHAQGEPIGDDRTGEMIHEVGRLRSRADVDGEATLAVIAGTVTVEPADPNEYVCEGHTGDDSVLLGGPEFCDGSCRPRREFGKHALIDLMTALDDAGLDESGGCGACALEAGQMCEGCGRCNCDRHDTCKRPAPAPAADR